MTAGPVYIAGLERSGTSLIYALLASHSQIAMTRRTNLWTHFFEQYGDLQDDANLERCISTMRRYKRLRKLDPDWNRLVREFRVGPRTYPSLFALIEEQHAERLGKPRWGDKSLNTERYANEIFRSYEGARILHMMRDPRDRFASSRTRWGTRRGGIGAGTAEWLSSAHLAERNAVAHPTQYRVVRYEDLVTDPVGALKDICAFIDAPYEPEMLTMAGAPRFLEQGSNSSYGRRDPGTISTGSIGRFREVLQPAQIAFAQHTAGDEMRHFGYELEPLELPVSQRLRYSVTSYPVELARMTAWRVRELVRNHRGRPVPAYRLVEAGSA